MSEVNIRNLESLIQQYTGPSKKLVNSKITKLTAPGENYIGLVYKVVATLRTEDGAEETFNAVAKCLNFGGPDFMNKMNAPQYNKEKAFYLEVVPALQDFQQEQGLEEPSIKDLFPVLYTCRSSLNDNSKEVDADAVLLFENLSEQGYSNADRTIGFDLEGAQLILKDLALFHATVIAFKLRKPKEFEEKIKIYLNNVFDFDKSEHPRPHPPKDNVWMDILKNYEEAKPYLQGLEKKLLMGPPGDEGKSKRSKEPFGSICHGDLWTNNTMQKFIGEKPIKNQFIDFQMYSYDSIAKDLLFFLCTSVKLSVFQEHFDHLIKFYHKIFINTLNKLGCDTNPFSYFHLLKELNEEASQEIGHAVTMLVVICHKKGEAVFDLSDGGPPVLKPENVSETARKRAAQIVHLFGQKGWI